MSLRKHRVRISKRIYFYSLRHLGCGISRSIRHLYSFYSGIVCSNLFICCGIRVLEMYIIVRGASLSLRKHRVRIPKRFYFYSLRHLGSGITRSIRHTYNFYSGFVFKFIYLLWHSRPRDVYYSAWSPEISSFQENVPNDAAEPAASRICLFPSPFLRERGGDDNYLHDARNFVARH